MKLVDFTQDRDNNFNLIRIVAALAVMLTHSFALATGSGAAEPLRDLLGMTMGTFAVDAFFITSGFLVTASLFARQSAIEFIWARFLRIFPALLVMLLLTVFGLGLFFTSVPVAAYLGDTRTYKYLLKGATLIAGVNYTLPGVFDENPYRGAVNGSLWTMPSELRMYALLVVTWVVLRAMPSRRVKAFERLIVISAGCSGVLILALHFYHPLSYPFAGLFFMFFSGAAFYVLRERITLSRSAFALIALALLVSATVDKRAFFLVYTLTVAYALFFLAYVPAGQIRSYNKIGDYSYGVYIYAFPVQQSITALRPGITVLALALCSAAITLPLAALSWHLLEKRALRLKGHFVGHTRRMLAYRLTGTSSRTP